MGHQAVSAASGLEALKRVSDAVDLVILDIMLPDIDGFAVYERLRRAGHGMPVIFLSARDATEDRVRGLTIGGDDYVVKPFAIEELLARIRMVLRRAGHGKRHPSGRSGRCRPPCPLSCT